jgi:uncharacterized protein (DUF779 family)
MWQVPSSSLKILKKNQSFSMSSLKMNLKILVAAAPKNQVPGLEQVSESSSQYSEATVDNVLTCDLDMVQYVLANACRHRAELADNQAQLEKNIRRHSQQAIVHQMGGCHKQAKKCTLNATQLKQERDLVCSAIDGLDMQIILIEAYLEEARLIHAVVEFNSMKRR